MKEKIKNVLFSISLFYSVVIVVFMCITLNNMKASIELNDSEENRNTIINYKEQLLTLEKNDCTKVIGKIIEHYEETSYTGNVNLREMYEYDNENSILSYYGEAKEKCAISKEDEEKYNFPIKFMTVSIQRDEIYQPYYFQYELSIEDRPMRLIAESAISNIEYKINRDMELEIISSLIELSNKEVVVNE